MKKYLNTLYVTKEDTWLSLDGETVAVSLHGERLLRLPLVNLEAIQTFGWNIGASPALMAACAERGIHLAFCNPRGRLLCNVSGFTHGNVLLRRQQYRLADNPQDALCVAKEMIAAKILNSRTVLQRIARDHNELERILAPVVVELAVSVRCARRTSSHAELLGVEGHAAERYFSIFSHLIIPADFSFESRNRRPPTDPVNALLSFVYSLLSNDCKSALEAVGLDSAVGLLHKDRPGRPGLALDLMEEFRAPLAERLVLSLLNRRQLKRNDFQIEHSGGVRLRDDARKVVLTAWQERKAEMIFHPFLKEKMTMGMLPHIQARLLAQHIRGALNAYPPMVWK